MKVTVGGLILTLGLCRWRLTMSLALGRWTLSWLWTLPLVLIAGRSPITANILRSNRAARQTILCADPAPRFF
jgi:hypothetical protein